MLAVISDNPYPYSVALITDWMFWLPESVSKSLSCSAPITLKLIVLSKLGSITPKVNADKLSTNRAIEQYIGSPTNAWDIYSHSDSYHGAEAATPWVIISKTGSLSPIAKLPCRI